MKLVLKILKWTALVVTVLLIALFCISEFMQNDIVTLFVNAINKNISTKIETGAGSFSLISKFPKASVKLENVLVHSSPKYDRTQFNGINTDTLLTAKSVQLEFRMADLIKGIYRIESLSIEKGILNILSDSSGRVNYDIYTSTAPSAGKGFIINLDKIIVSELNTAYINTATGIDIRGLMKSGRFKSRISGNNIDFSASSAMLLSKLEAYPISLKTSTSASLEINLQKSDSGYFFRKGTLKIENFNFGISGLISPENNLNLKITGRNIDISKISKFLPPRYISKIKDIDPAGILRIDCRLKGPVDRKNNPEVLIYFALDNGHIYYKKSGLKLEKLSFYGNYKNGKLKNPESSYLQINKAIATLGSADFSCALTVENFVSPKIDLVFSGEIIPSELTGFLNFKEISAAEGSVRLNVKLSGHLPLKDKYSPADLLKLNPEADLQFKSMGFGLTKKNIKIKDINGNVKITRQLVADGLSFSYNGQRIKVDGNFINLPSWLAGQPVYIKGIADITIESFKPSAFLPDSSSRSAKPAYFKLPDGIDLDINLNIDTVSYKKFSGNNLKGRLIYKPGLLSFKSFSISSFDGNISGDCFVGNASGKSYMSRGSISYDQVDIHKAFASLNNFLQDFIKAENLSGSISGEMSFLLPLDSLLYPRFNTATAEGKFTIRDGVLINFEPVKSLSRYIELSELENITFSKLENEFYVRNNYIAFPQMDIQSSAADFTISGKHDFENNYEYHAKTRLSVLLSKKVKKNRPRTSEFGAIEDDGLGRTSIFLKITGKGDDVKVGYDMKAVRGNVNKNLKTEKDNLKSILNKEYGWYKKDTTIKQEPAPRPKFRIRWDETDSTNNQIDTSKVNKDRGINSIFKRKRNGN